MADNNKHHNNAPVGNARVDTAFDIITRILASPMPRRQALRTVAGMLGGIALAVLWQSRVFGQGNIDSTNASSALPVLQVQVTNYAATNAKVIDVVLQLRNEFGASINFMEHAHGPNVNVNVKKGTIQDVLQQIQQQDPAYQVKTILGRLFVYPDLPALNVVITPPFGGKTIRRITAAGEFTDYLQEHVKGFEKFGTWFAGSLSSGLFQNTVTLSKRGTVLEYLAELAGDNPEAALDIAYFSNDWYAFNVRQVVTRKAKLGSASSQKTSILDLPITNFSLKGVQIYNVINTLGQQYQVPVSFIDASDKTEDSRFDPKNPYAPYYLTAVGHPTFTIDIKSGTVRDVLNQLVKQDPSYQYGMVGGRLVVYPNQAKFNTVVSDVHIHKKPRGDAAVDYVFETLSKHVKGFEDYGTAIGSWGVPPDAPIYMEPVTLSSQGTVLEQMVELLGSNPQLVFSVVVNSSGTSTFQFGTVGPQPPFKPQELALPEPLGTNYQEHGSIKR